MASRSRSRQRARATQPRSPRENDPGQRQRRRFRTARLRSRCCGCSPNRAERAPSGRPRSARWPGRATPGRSLRSERPPGLGGSPHARRVRSRPRRESMRTYRRGQEPPRRQPRRPRRLARARASIVPRLFGVARAYEPRRVGRAHRATRGLRPEPLPPFGSAPRAGGPWLSTTSRRAPRHQGSPTLARMARARMNSPQTRGGSLNKGSKRAQRDGDLCARFVLPQSAARRQQTRIA